MDIEADLRGFSFLDDIGLDIGEGAVQGLPDTGDINVVADLEGIRCAFEMEGNHAPVHDVGAVAFGGIFLSDVGQAADDALAGGRLFTGAAVAGLVGIDHGPDLDLLYINTFGAGDRADDLVDLCKSRVLFGRITAGNTEPLCPVDFLGPPDIFGVAPGEGELRQAQGVGAEGGCFTGGDEFVSGRHFIEDLGADLQQDVVRQRLQFRPGLDVGAVKEADFRLCLPESLIDARPVDRVVKIMSRHIAPDVIVRRGSEDSSVGRRRRNGPGVHEGCRRHLAFAGLGSFAVREIPCCMADRQAVVHGGVAGAEAGTAEGGLDDGSRCHEVRDIPLPGQVDEDRLRRRIDIERELAVSAALTAEHIGCLDNI